MNVLIVVNFITAIVAFLTLAWKRHPLMALVNIIRNAHAKGYKVSLYYYWLESAEASYRRVLQRAEEERNDMSVDNHSIPEDVIRRRYPKSIDNLIHIFISIVDFWQVYDDNLGFSDYMVFAGE